jgi:hypothetical protein
VLAARILGSLSPVEAAAASVPLALFLLLTETTLGTFGVTLYLRLRGGITPGFTKFMASTDVILGLLALLTVAGLPVSAYVHHFGIQSSAAGLLTALQALTVAALVLYAVLSWRKREGLAVAAPAAGLGVLLLADVAITLAPLSGTWWGEGAIVLAVLLSTIVLGAATTGMLLGHWYLVTPALTNRPLLQAIAMLVLGLVLQAPIFVLALAGLWPSGGSVARPLYGNPILSILWALGAIALPLVAGALAWPACRIRSFMSTTGLLYLAMIALLPGQLVGLVLLFVAAA